jgi:WD40-like Beta Propeller Repeat
MQPRKTSGVVLLFCFLLSAAALAASASALGFPLRNYKLSGEMPSFGDVQSEPSGLTFEERVQISPDGKHVVFLADKDTEGVYELYSAPLDGSLAAQRISGPHTADTFTDFKILPDSSRVIYWTYRSSTMQAQLISVPITGGPRAILSNDFSAPVNSGLVDRFKLSGDSARVVFLVEEGPQDAFVLYSVPSGGGQAIKISRAVSEGDVAYFQLTPDGQRVVYSLDTGRGEVNSVPIGGGSQTTLVGNFQLFNQLYNDSFFLSADGTKVLFIIDHLLINRKDIYSVPTGGGGGPLVPVYADVSQGGQDSIRYQISPNNQWIVVKVNYFDGKKAELYSVPAAGGQKNDLLKDLFDVVYEAKITPESDRVVYQGEKTNSTDSNLYSIPLGGGNPLQLNTLPGDPYIFLVAPDGRHVVYTAHVTFPHFELFAAPAAGGGAVKLNAPLVTGASVWETFKITPDSRSVIYHADQQAKGIHELYRVPITGGDFQKINDPLVIDGDVQPYGFAINGDSNTVVYVADQDTNDKEELYATFLGASVYLPIIER